MDTNIFSALCNTIAATLTMVMFYPVAKAKNVVDLNDALKTRPLLAKVVINKNSRSYNRTCIYFSIALAAYTTSNFIRPCMARKCICGRFGRKDRTCSPLTGANARWGNRFQCHPNADQGKKSRLGIFWRHG